MNIITRRCTKCGKEKPISDFCCDNKRKDGLEIRCRSCRSEYMKLYRKTHPEQAKKDKKLFRERHPDYTRNSFKKWEENNPDRARETHNAWRHEHPEIQRRWNAKHPDVGRIARANRRTAENATEKHKITTEEWEAIKADYGYRCAYCNEKKPLHMEHVTPISKGGKHIASNIVPACQSCNYSKSQLPLLIWLYRKVIK